MKPAKSFKELAYAPRDASTSMERQSSGTSTSLAYLHAQGFGLKTTWRVFDVGQLEFLAYNPLVSRVW